MSPPKALVVGSGVIGLRTALELLHHRIPTILRSPLPPTHPSTCSSGAGGLWMPYKSTSPLMTHWSRQTLLSLLSQTSGGMVEIVPVVIPKKGIPVDDEEWHSFPELKFRRWSMEELESVRRVAGYRMMETSRFVAEGYTHCYHFETAIVDSPRMLQAMLDEVTSHPLSSVDVSTSHFYTDVDEMMRHARDDFGCNIVVNCTGLGSKTLVAPAEDASLTGGRGVLLHYPRYYPRRQRWEGTRDIAMTIEDPPWGTANEPCYVIPRGDVLVIGGTFYPGDEERTIREGERRRLERNASLMLGVEEGGGGEGSVGEWVGWRPYREGGMRVALGEEGRGRGVRVVHNYGHGGSGWTVFVGVAREVARLLGLKG